MSDYTPTTDYIRATYSDSNIDDFQDELQAEFDRWLTAHDDATRIAVLEEAAVDVIWHWDVPTSELPLNPDRAAIGSWLRARAAAVKS